VLNFANEDIAGTIRSEHLPPGSQVTDMFTGNQVGTVDDLHSFVAELPPHHGMSLLVEASDAGDRDLPDWPTHHRLTNKRGLRARGLQKLKAQNFQPEPGKNRWETSVMLNNDNRVQIGVTDRYAGQFYPLVDTTGADRIRIFAIAEITMIGDLLFGRR
jgi:hypothetical protein